MTMIPKAGYYTPLFHVNRIEESMRFYGLLGFEIDQMGEHGRLEWAGMQCEGGAIMFLRAEEPHPPKKKFEVLFAMYTPDLLAFREHRLPSGSTSDSEPLGIYSALESHRARAMGERTENPASPTLIRRGSSSAPVREVGAEVGTSLTFPITGQALLPSCP